MGYTKPFWKRVEKRGDCLIWRGSTTRGYGTLTRDCKIHYAHRFAWSLVNGPIPPGLCVLHVCDTPLCVSPDHLRLGTHADNVADKIAKGRQPLGKAHWKSKLTSDLVYWIRASKLPQTTIADWIGVDSSTISNVQTRTTWRHLPPALTQKEG